MARRNGPLEAMVALALALGSTSCQAFLTFESTAPPSADGGAGTEAGVDASVDSGAADVGGDVIVEAGDAGGFSCPMPPRAGTYCTSFDDPSVPYGTFPPLTNRKNASVALDADDATSPPRSLDLKASGNGAQAELDIDIKSPVKAVRCEFAWKLVAGGTGTLTIFSLVFPSTSASLEVDATGATTLYTNQNKSQAVPLGVESGWHRLVVDYQSIAGVSRVTARSPGGGQATDAFVPGADLLVVQVGMVYGASGGWEIRFDDARCDVTY